MMIVRGFFKLLQAELFSFKPPDAYKSFYSLKCEGNISRYMELPHVCAGRCHF